MAAGKYTAKIEAGANWRVVVIVKGLDLTNATARLMARHTMNGDVKMTLTDTDGIAIVVTDTNTATLTITRSAAETTALDLASGIYDLEVVLSGGAVYRILEGVITTSPEVTRV